MISFIADPFHFLKLGEKPYLGCVDLAYFDRKNDILTEKSLLQKLFILDTTQKKKKKTIFNFSVEAERNNSVKSDFFQQLKNHFLLKKKKLKQTNP